MSEQDASYVAAEAFRTLLHYVGDDPDREGLLETPKRALKAFEHFTSGYGQDPQAVLKTFENGAARVDEMVVQLGVPFWSTCVVGSTFVETPRGRVPIQYLKDDDFIYTVDPDSFELGLVKCRRPRITRAKARLVRVYADNDTVLCTPDHKFLTYNRGWVEASDLVTGDRVVSLYRVANPNHDGHVWLTGRKYAKKSDDPLISMAWQRGGNIAEHRLVWWFQSGRKLKRRPIHHINEIPWDNDPRNLEAVTINQHNRVHNKLLSYNTAGTPEFERRKLNAALASGRPEVRAKRSASVKASWELRRNHVIIGVEPLSIREDVWCMDVPGTKTFFANGMAVHNCEHHLLPFWGLAHIGYVPTKRIVGLSKLSRMVEIFARRLTVQEHLTVNVAQALMEGLDARGVGVVMQCRHSCMESRGIQKAGTVTVTSVMRGVFRDKPETRAEFLSLVNEAVVGRVL